MKQLAEYIFVKKNFQLHIFTLWYMKIMTDFTIYQNHYIILSITFLSPTNADF